MRIERLRSHRIIGLGNVDWTFPEGPVLLFCEDRSDHKMLGKLLMELFYQVITPSTFRAESKKGLLEVWMAGENTRFHILQNFIQQGHEFVPSTTLVTEQVTGQNVPLPDNMTLGDYLFGINVRTFSQGVVVGWPSNNECHHLSLRVNNLRQGGDEGLSLIKIRASLAGAHQKMSEQKGSMMLAKAEYDTLRCEWDAAHRQQDEDRLLSIEIKKLQENEGILSERIASDLKMQERIASLTQNPDYRELRQLQGELTQIEERLQNVELKLKTLTSESEVDWVMIENLREECLEWASLQEQVERLDVVTQMQADKNAELKGSLQTCGYEGLSRNEDQHLSRVTEERDAAQEQLNKLKIIKDDLKATQLINSVEIAQLFYLADMAGVTEEAEDKLARRERHLKLWQSSKIGCTLDRLLRKHFRGTSIGEMIASRLAQYYEGYHTLNHEEFTTRLKDFRNQQRRVESVQIQLEQLKERLGKEDKLLSTVVFRTELLTQAFRAAKVTDLPAWLNGWEDYQKKKQQLALKNDELQLLLEQSRREDEKLQACTSQLREKLGKWDTLATDRDEVLASVFKVATQLRAKDEAEKDNVAYSQRFKDLLGDRTMEGLTALLEPLADLERAKRVSNERMGEVTACQKERLNIRKQREAAEQRLQSSQKFPSLSVLEQKIATVKSHWMGLMDLDRAIVDAQVLLETSWQEWQAKFGNALNNEMKWILSRISASSVHEPNPNDLLNVQRDYFAYRMAIAQLSLGIYTEIPLFFSVGEIDVVERFWVKILEYFQKLSLTRQMILITTSPKLGEKLIGDGWTCFRWSELKNI